MVEYELFLQDSRKANPRSDSEAHLESVFSTPGEGPSSPGVVFYVQSNNALEYTIRKLALQGRSLIEK